MRSAYRTWMRFYPGGPKVPVRWFRVPMGTPFLPVPTIFNSYNWDDCEGDGGWNSYRGTVFQGELLGEGRIWDRGRVPPGTVLPPVHYCGTPDMWMGRLTVEANPPVPAAPGGWPACCHPSPVIVPAGGLAFGGEAPVTSGSIYVLAAKVRLAATAPVGNVFGFQPVPFTDVVYDASGLWSPVAQAFFVPAGKAGLWQFGASVAVRTADSYARVPSLSLTIGGGTNVQAAAKVPEGDPSDSFSGRDVVLSVYAEGRCQEGDDVSCSLGWWSDDLDPTLSEFFYDGAGPGPVQFWCHYVGPLPPDPPFAGGGVAFGGSADFGVGVYLAPEGGVSVGGTAPLTTGAGVVIMPAGGVAFGGSAVIVLTPAPFTGGGVAFGGAAGFRFFPVYFPTGGVSFGGDAPIS